MGIECGLRLWGISHGELWQHGGEVGSTTRGEIAGWLDGVPVCVRLAQAILSTRVMRPALDWLAWACELVSA